MGASASSGSHSGAQPPITMQHHHHHHHHDQTSNTNNQAHNHHHPQQTSSSAGVGRLPSRSTNNSSSYRHNSGGGGTSSTTGNIHHPSSSSSMTNIVDGGGDTTPGSHLMINRPEPLANRQQTHVLSYDTVGLSTSRSSRNNNNNNTNSSNDNMFTSSSAGDNNDGGTSSSKNKGGSSSSSGGIMMFAPNHQLEHNNYGSSGGTSGTATSGLCLNPASELNSRLDTQVEIKVYPCNNSSHGGNNNNNNRKKCTQFIVKPEGVIIQGTNRPPSQDIGTEYSRHIGRKLPRYELSDTRASQLLITSHLKNYYVIPAPEAFSRHSGTCRLLGDRKHNPCNHNLKVGDFLRVGSVGVVVIETHNGTHYESMSEERIQRIMQDTTVGGYVDAEETDLEEDNSDVETSAGGFMVRHATSGSMPTLPSPTKSGQEYDVPTCYMCFDDEDTQDNPLISPCKCKGDTQFVHVDCLRKWHTAEADNQICFLSTVDATCSVCKSTFKSDFRLKSGHLVKLFQSSLEPPYVSLLIATKHEMAQRLFNTRFQLSFKTLMKPDGKNATRPLLLGRSSGSDMVLDYRTVSARHATIKYKNGEFVFSDAGSSNGSYLYVRQPVELCPNAPSVQFRLGRSMISMKVVNKWNRRLLRAVTRRSGGHTPTFPLLSQGGGGGGGGNHSTTNSDAGDHNANINDLHGGNLNGGCNDKKTRESILKTMPNLGMLDQQSSLHLDLIYALAIPKRELLLSSKQSQQQRDRTSSSMEPISPASDHPSAQPIASSDVTSTSGSIVVPVSTTVVEGGLLVQEENNALPSVVNDVVVSSSSSNALLVQQDPIHTTTTTTSTTSPRFVPANENEDEGTTNYHYPKSSGHNSPERRTSAATGEQQPPNIISQDPSPSLDAGNTEDIVGTLEHQEDNITTTTTTTSPSRPMYNAVEQLHHVDDHQHHFTSSSSSPHRSFSTNEGSSCIRASSFVDEENNNNDDDGGGAVVSHEDNEHKEVSDH